MTNIDSKWVMKTKNIKSLKPIQAIYFKDFAGVSAVKEDGEGNPMATGYLAAFGNKDSQKDVIHKGAFAKSIQERGPQSNTARKIAFLYAHDMKIPLGRFTKLEEKSQGLYYEAKLDNIPFVRDTITPQLKSGTLNQHSVGYNYVWDKIEYDEDHDQFDVYELETFEGSLAVLGSNENTPFLGFKNLFDCQDAVGELADRANVILRNLNDYQKEFELRTILQKYQTLYNYAAGEFKKFSTVKKAKPKKVDMRYIVRHL